MSDIVSDALKDVLEESMEDLAEEAVSTTLDNVSAREDAVLRKPDAVADFTGKTDELPSDKADYMRMSVAEKVRCYGFDMKGTDQAFNMVKAYFDSVGMDAGFDDVYEEAKLLTDYCAKEVAGQQISEKVEQILQRMDVWNINPEQIDRYPTDVLAEVFDLKDVDYYTGIKVFGSVLDRKGMCLEQQEKYELFEKIYEEGMREKRQENTKGGR